MVVRKLLKKQKNKKKKKKKKEEELQCHKFLQPMLIGWSNRSFLSEDVFHIQLLPMAGRQPRCVREASQLKLSHGFIMGIET
jgi:hypothetical protein